ncbi:protein PAT1 homolog 1 [Aedes aegypti]|uniref:mRNA decay factor PAT1 domain-containing protein n=1 Tax=Aedes aegypti TaxID=7159 RepID=A0A6I8U0M1_AEDAE|nr:protein PAT1 homolog 1 [Aedes aegypti]
MTDSFFGFDTSLPVEDDGGGGIGGTAQDDSEEEYDALNDETFGMAAREGDWEGLHEDLVRMDQREGGDGDSGPDSDLDINFSAVRIDNLEMNDDNESEARLHDSTSAPRIAGPASMPFPGFPPNFSLPNPSQMRICSVEEIEQNMIKQQAQQLQQHPLVPPRPPPQQHENLQHQYHQNLGLARPPPGFPTAPALMSQPPLTIPVNFPPPLNMGPPPPLHLLQTNIPPPGSGPPLFPLNVPPPNFQEQQNHANFNQRLVQEIQQNHPLLAQHRHHQQQHQQNRYQQHNNRQNYHQQQHQNRHQNGKINRSGEYDEYANLMSERDKQWLLGIQLSQLNKDTPYFNDYYFCVFRDRKERQKGENERESKAHKDNTFYHPFTQQMLQRNGLIGRERRNSEKSQDIKEVPARNYTPLQFENSLGKLQCGSVTAPRKIIDQDVVAESSTNTGTAVSSEVLSQRKSRQILLHVESLYKIALKMEDLSNPLAIEAKQLLKEKKERERMLALERGQQVDEQNNVTVNGIDGSSDAQEDTFDSMLEKLLPGLSPEGVLMTLSVRKGKLLLKRIQAIVKDHPFRWILWCTILTALPLLPKRDRDDPEGLLSPLFAQLESHVKYSTLQDLLPLLDTFLNSDKLLPLVPKCKFLLTTVLTLIDRLEHFHSTPAVNLPAEAIERWKTFLKELSRAVGGVGMGPQKVLLKLDSNCKIIRTLRDHFQRYPALELELKLLALISVEDKK